MSLNHLTHSQPDGQEHNVWSQNREQVRRTKTVQNAIDCPIYTLYSVSQNKPLRFSDIFPKRLGIFSPKFTCLLYVPIYAGLQIIIQLYHKRDHQHMLKMSTIGQNARWVVALNME